MRVDEFQDFLNKDLAWRKMEISQLFGILSTAESKSVVCKSMILLLYAHWEGFIKKSSKCYLKYVSDKNIKIQDLTRNFEAIMLKRFARECIDKDSNNLAKEFALLDKQQKSAGRPFKISIDIEDEFDTDFIDTQNNLSSKVLANIIQLIGIKYNDAIKTRGQFVDVNLLKHRNSIGHGSQVSAEDPGSSSALDFDQIVKLKDFVILMLDYFSDVLLKYVEEEYYLQSKITERDVFEQKQEEKLSKKLEQIEKR